MAKTTKYFMQVFLGDSLYDSEMYITKKQFNEQLKQLKKQYEDFSKIDDPEFIIEYEVTTKDFESFTKTRHEFDYGVNSIWLTEYKCKEGYCFK